jgi:hypothetical protein
VGNKRNAEFGVSNSEGDLGYAAKFYVTSHGVFNDTERLRLFSLDFETISIESPHSKLVEDATLLAAVSRSPFYFVQSCSSEVIATYGGRGDPESVLTIKKNVLKSIAGGRVRGNVVRSMDPMGPLSHRILVHNATHLHMVTDTVRTMPKSTSHPYHKESSHAHANTKSLVFHPETGHLTLALSTTSYATVTTEEENMVTSLHKKNPHDNSLPPSADFSMKLDSSSTTVFMFAEEAPASEVLKRSDHDEVLGALFRTKLHHRGHGPDFERFHAERKRAAAENVDYRTLLLQLEGVYDDDQRVHVDASLALHRTMREVGCSRFIQGLRDHIDSVALSRTNRLGLLNVLATSESCPDAEEYILDVAADTDLPWQDRNRALISLSLLREPSLTTMEHLEESAFNPAAIGSDYHTKRQGVLVFGEMLFKMESARASHVKRAMHQVALCTDGYETCFADEVEERSEAVRTAAASYRAAQLYGERGRRRIYDALIAADGHADVELLGMALQNSLKHKSYGSSVWAERKTAILRKRGLITPEDVDTHVNTPANRVLNSERATMATRLEKALHKRQIEGSGSGTPKTNSSDLAGESGYGGVVDHFPELTGNRSADYAAFLGALDGTIPHLPGEVLNVTEKLASLFAQAECFTFGSCFQYSFTMQKPKDEPQLGSQVKWNETLGFDKAYVLAEAIADFRANPTAGTKRGLTDNAPWSPYHYPHDNDHDLTPDQSYGSAFFGDMEDINHLHKRTSLNPGAFYEYFAGAGISAVILEAAEVQLAAAYAKGTFVAQPREGVIIKDCMQFAMSIYFAIWTTAYYVDSNANANCTYCCFEPECHCEETCEANYPVRDSVTYEELAHISFWNNSNADVSVDGMGDFRLELELYGSVGFNYGYGFMVAEAKGGTSLNGLVEPIAKADFAARFLYTLLTYGGVDILSVGVEVVFNLLSIGFPITGALNANTLRGCGSFDICTRALGGELNIIIDSIFGRQREEIFHWDGLEFCFDIVSTSCCVECEEACYNAFCNYRFGECECIIGYDGPGCDIECPPDCLWPEGYVHPGVDCITGPDIPRGATCQCNAGSYGWNCMSACPGGRETPCHNNGYCDDTGLCHCDPDFYGDDCSITCPLDESGARCGNNGRCVFNGETANCVCFANFVGPECEAICPLTEDARAAPCSRRGDCFLLDGTPQCMCHLGFYGELCDQVDRNGAGMALEFVEPLGAGVVFAGQNSTQEIDSLPASGTYLVSTWFKVNVVPEASASLFTWKFGSLEVTRDGVIRYCSGREGECYDHTMTVTAGQWYFVSVEVRLSSGQLVIHMANPGEELVTVGPTAFSTNPWPLKTSFSGIGVAYRYRGHLDLMSVLQRPEANGEFSNAEVVRMASEIVGNRYPGLLFYLMFDLARGDHVYDQVHLTRGSLPARGTEERFFRSDVLINTATINSEPHIIELTSTPEPVTFKLGVDGRQLIDASFNFVANSEGRTCSITVGITDELGNTVANALSAPVSVSNQPSAQVSAFFTDAALSKVRDGDNILLVSGSGGCTLTDAYLGARTPGTDTGVEFDGSPFSYIEADNRPGYIDMGASGFTIEMWVFRDPVLLTFGGLLYSVVSKTIAMQDFDVRNDNHWSLLLHETGSNGRGFRAQFKGTDAKHTFENYASPVGRWFHMSMSLSHSGSSCTVKLMIDSVDQALNGAHPHATSVCGEGKVTGFGTAATSSIRIGSGFGGVINDVLLRKGNRGPAAVRADMYKLTPYLDFAGKTDTYWSVMTFEETQEENPRAVRNDESSSWLEEALVEGAFRSLIYGVFHQWKMCPGTSRFSPETVCSTRTYWEQGYCEEREGVNVYGCVCNHGYLGFDCSGVCPGGVGNICSNHGVCETFNQTVCICDPGYVGPACEHECPGWSEPENLDNPRICWGFGECVLNDAGTGSKCMCDQEFDRYGAWCQFTYGEDPVASIEEPCKSCDAPLEQCVDGVCTCKEGAYRYFGVCKGDAARGALSLALAAVAIFVQL